MATVKKATTYKGAEEEKVGKIKPLLPKTKNQEEYIKALAKYQQVISIGSSGTGKTYIAATTACNLYLRGLVKKIILTRPNVGVGPKSGYLPGTLEEKYDPVFAPIADLLKEQLTANKFATDVKNGNIVLRPLEYMRGTTLEDAFVILDEAQNTTIAEMKMFNTRIGENVTIVMNGDIKQSDIKEQSGLSNAIRLASKYAIDLKIIEFTPDDIIRSHLCKQWVMAYDGENL